MHFKLNHVVDEYNRQYINYQETAINNNNN